MIDNEDSDEESKQSHHTESDYVSSNSKDEDNGMDDVQKEEQFSPMSDS